MKKAVVAVMLAASVCISMPTFAAEPSLHEVYQAANSGKVDDAQRMMKEVLQAHPNSGKAHYVEAELLSKQGKLKQAADELATAEKLAPALPFATPQAGFYVGSMVSIPKTTPSFMGPVALGGDAPPVLIAGPCIAEHEDMARTFATPLKAMPARHGFPCVLQAS